MTCFDISFITINYNGFEDTCELIESIHKVITNHTYEIIVVDNASKNKDAERIQNKFHDVKVIYSKENLGFAGGNNLGLKHASGKYIMFINNDTIVEEDNIGSLLERLDSNPSIGIVCPKIKYHWNHSLIQYAGFTPLSKITLRNKGIGYNEKDEGQYDKACPTCFVHGAAMITRKSTIDIVGEMSEVYFLYYEEIDWSEEFHKKGYQIWYEPKCVIYHKESKSTGINSPLKAYYLTRNRLIFAKRHRKMPFRILSYLYLISVSLLHCITCNRLEISKATFNGLIDFIDNKYYKL